MQGCRLMFPGPRPVWCPFRGPLQLIRLKPCLVQLRLTGIFPADFLEMSGRSVNVLHQWCSARTKQDCIPTHSSSGLTLPSCLSLSIYDRRLKMPGMILPGLLLHIVEGAALLAQEKWQVILSGQVKNTRNL